MKPIIPSLGLSRLRDTELDEYAQEKVDKLTGNANYPPAGAFPELSEVQFALDVYRIALAKADDGTKADVENKNVKRALLEDALAVLALRCSQIAAGNLVVFLTSGFEARSQGDSVGVLPAPANFKLAEGTAAGTLKASWKKLLGARTYVLQLTQTPNNENSWLTIAPDKGGLVTKARTVILDLLHGKRYWLRVAGINGAGVGAYSAEDSHIPQ